MTEPMMILAGIQMLCAMTQLYVLWTQTRDIEKRGKSSERITP